MQLSFGDAEQMGKRKRTRKEIFLAQMDQVVPWKALLALIEPHYPKTGQPGRQPYPLGTMLRIHFLQQWYALSDPGMEEALYDTAVLRQFARLSGLDAIPDETTIQFGYAKVRYRGLAKNTAQVLTLFALSNLWMARRRLLQPTG